MGGNLGGKLQRLRRKERFSNLARRRLVRAAWEQRHQHHQIRKREKPLVRAGPCCFRGPRDKSQVPAPREIVQVFHTNPRQAGNFRLRKNLLTRLDRDQELPLSFSAVLVTFHLVRCTHEITSC